MQDGSNPNLAILCERTTLSILFEFFREFPPELDKQHA